MYLILHVLASMGTISLRLILDDWYKFYYHFILSHWSCVVWFTYFIDTYDTV